MNRLNTSHWARGQVNYAKDGPKKLEREREPWTHLEWYDRDSMETHEMYARRPRVAPK